MRRKTGDLDNAILLITKTKTTPSRPWVLGLDIVKAAEALDPPIERSGTYSILSRLVKSRRLKRQGRRGAQEYSIRASTKTGARGKRSMQSTQKKRVSAAARALAVAGALSPAAELVQVTQRIEHIRVSLDSELRALVARQAELVELLDS